MISLLVVQLQFFASIRRFLYQVEENHHHGVTVLFYPRSSRRCVYLASSNSRSSWGPNRGVSANIDVLRSSYGNLWTPPCILTCLKRKMEEATYQPYHSSFGAGAFEGHYTSLRNVASWISEKLSLITQQWWPCCCLNSNACRSILKAIWSNISSHFRPDCLLLSVTSNPWK